MLNRTLFTARLRHFLCVKFSVAHQFGMRTLLSQAYRCEDAWNKRLESPLLKNIEMDEYFIQVDKKFGTKNLASGVDIDLFANNVEDTDQLDELEHLLYRFRITKRSPEIMDSTVSAVVRIYLKLKDYKSLFRILSDQNNYGIFPDLFLYNILMDTFIEQKMYREAAQIAILMMLQEDFSNEIARFLAVYSCHLFMKNNLLEELYSKPETEAKEEEDDDEEVLERVPFLRNPWFDDHFDLKEPRHLIGKTLFLATRQMKDDLLGKTFQLLGLGMYEKWDAVVELLNSAMQSETVLLSEGVDEFKKFLDSVPNDELKLQIENILKQMQESNQIKSGDFERLLNSKISSLPELEKIDIKKQEELFNSWEKQREDALRKQNIELDRQRRLAEIEKTKEYLYWKEKLLFFFEKEDWLLEDFKKAKEMEELVKSQKTPEETYVVPDIIKKAPEKITKYQKLIKVKKI